MKLPPPGLQVATLPDQTPVPGRSPTPAGGDTTFFVGRDLIEEVQRNGPKRKWYDIGMIEYALEGPSAILEGLQRPNFDDGYCYSLLPTFWFVDEINRGLPPPLKVFCVYVHPSEGKLLVLDWDWRIMKPKEPGVPANWRRCFRGIVWQAN